MRLDDDQIIEPVGYDFGWSRRSFMQVLGAGVLISVTAGPALGQQQQRRGGRNDRPPVALGARLHIGTDGVVTVMTGKVEGGQGSRAQITQAAAEELGIAANGFNGFAPYFLSEAVVFQHPGPTENSV